MNISEQLKLIRLQRFEGSTKRMAEALLMSRNQLANYINGISVSDRMVERIAERLSVDKNWLLTGEQPPVKHPDVDQLLAIIESQQRTIERLSMLVK